MLLINVNSEVHGKFASMRPDAARLSAQSFSSVLTPEIRRANGGRGGMDVAKLPSK